MAKYYNKQTDMVEEVGDPKFNPELISGKTLVPETTPLGAFSGTDTAVTPSGATVNTVTGELLTPGTPKDYTTPTTPPATFPPAPDATTATGTVTKSMEDMIQELIGTSGLEAEKTAYQLEQEKAAGLEETKTKEADYTAQYKQLESEYKNLQIESQKVPYQVQGEFTGRAGTYQQGLMSEARQREITLKSLDVSARANTVSGLLLATQGLITAAEKRVEKAVADKYAVREAERKTKLENLELLSKSPMLTIEQKARADAQTAAIKKQEDADKKKKADSDAIMKMAVEVAGNPSAPKGLADKISAIGLSDNPDLSGAFQLYSPFAKQEKPVTTADLTEFKAFFPNVDISTPAGQQQFLDWKARMEEYAPTQYAREWQEAGGELGTGMTRSEWIQYRTGIQKNAGREFADEEFRIAFRNMQEEDMNYEQALSEIEKDTSIRNKDRAKLIASEIFGEKKESTEESKGLFGTVSSFFGRLFGK